MALALPTYDTQDLLPVLTLDAATPEYAGVAFDGRFVTFIPAGAGFGTVVRYDTLSTFTADCAWSTADLGALPAGGALHNFNGAVFDGQYLYLQFARSAPRSDRRSP